MKKIVPVVLIAAFGLVSLASCKKNYTCTCKSSTGATVATYPFTKVKKKDAKAACDTWNSSLAVSGGSCSL